MKFYEMSEFKKRSSTGFVLFVFFAVITLASSCITTKKIVYFRDLPDTMPKPVVMDQAAPYTEPKIESNDLLAITVQPMLQTVAGSSSNGGASQSSPGGASSAAQGPGQGASTYLVDQNGEIEYPLIGTVKLAGLTITEAKNLIKENCIHILIKYIHLGQFTARILIHVVKLWKTRNRALVHFSKYVFT